MDLASRSVRLNASTERMSGLGAPALTRYLNIEQAARGVPPAKQAVVIRLAFVEEREEFALATPHLSYSRINRYLTCPEQYRLYYVENLRPRLAAASLVFGQVVHQALAHLFREQGDPLQFFLAEWNEACDFDLGYRQRESWEKLKLSGEALLERFVREDMKRIGNVKAAEKTFELRITSLDLPVVGIIDLLADVDGKRTVIDFKTSSSA